MATRQRSDRHPCGICLHNCKHDYLICGHCDRWFHSKCVVDDNNVLENLANVDYVCLYCRTVDRSEKVRGRAQSGDQLEPIYASADDITISSGMDKLKLGQKERKMDFCCACHNAIRKQQVQKLHCYTCNSHFHRICNPDVSQGQYREWKKEQIGFCPACSKKVVWIPTGSDKCDKCDDVFGMDQQRRYCYKCKSHFHRECIPEVKESTPVEKALVRISYVAEYEDELNLVKGQLITVLKKELRDGSWWKGEVGGKVGVFPTNRVKLVREEPPKLPDKAHIADQKPDIKANIPETGRCPACSKQVVWIPMGSDLCEKCDDVFGMDQQRRYCRKCNSHFHRECIPVEILECPACIN